MKLSSGLQFDGASTGPSVRCIHCESRQLANVLDLLNQIMMLSHGLRHRRRVCPSVIFNARPNHPNHNKLPSKSYFDVAFNFLVVWPVCVGRTESGLARSLWVALTSSLDLVVTFLIYVARPGHC
ncbi:hypothetical protein ElyMa_002365800 [Elysia marginata]|uniref:G-protein coupled receptors family 1 profile domain-containing protein n=1 Tax=Elysia marginata TaxID=1093978 RepID=A0AAV4GA54_9GAST|nr:hypothetical protein ElyMa_002365800 [Elysia marginata]